MVHSKTSLRAAGETRFCEKRKRKAERKRKNFPRSFPPFLRSPRFFLYLPYAFSTRPAMLLLPGRGRGKMSRTIGRAFHPGLSGPETAANRSLTEILVVVVVTPVHARAPTARTFTRALKLSRINSATLLVAQIPSLPLRRPCLNPVSPHRSIRPAH